MNDRKVVLITGANRGLGYETALKFAREGHIAYTSMRDMKKAGNIMTVAERENLALIPIELDITDERSIRACADKIIEREKRIDILVNNAGIGYLGFITDASEEDMKSHFETNVYGTLKVTKHIARHMIGRRSGTIVNISGANGIAAFPGMGLYSACKSAIESLSETFCLELGYFGIKVRDIIPGTVNTGMENRPYDFYKGLNEADPAWEGLPGKLKAFYADNIRKAVMPEKAAVIIYKAAMRKSGRLRYSCLGQTGMLLMIRKILSDRWFMAFFKKLVFPYKQNKAE
ncbi:MAG: SDR family NAD(P)-dependent oxidoreductase [Spirochaetes bacterium]|nr:SDR family NAD(P)-dependent oxidoreductase [Spirochaetota bacterium]